MNPLCRLLAAHLLKRLHTRAKGWSECSSGASEETGKDSHQCVVRQFSILLGRLFEGENTV